MSTLGRLQIIMTKLLLVLTILTQVILVVASNNNNSNSIILRVRNNDGSMHKLQISIDTKNEKSLMELLQDCNILNGNEKEDDNEEHDILYNKSVINAEQSMEELGLSHGSMIQIRNRSSSVTKEASSKESDSSSTIKSNSKTTEDKDQENKKFIPYPELAKSQSFTTSLRRTRALKRRHSNGAMSYGDLQKLSSLYMHTIETQTKGSIERIYMCRMCAERFAISSSGNNKKIALLFGTTSKELVDVTALRSPRTSLHSTTEKEDMCQVVKVHAIWEPQLSTDDTLLEYNDSIKPILKIAQKLGLTVVGWIFAHNNREDTDIPIPFMNSKDVYKASKLQLQNMKYFGCDIGQHFISLSLDCDTGSTEAFQISDVSVQIMSEGVISDDNSISRSIDDRYLDTIEPLLINGQETNKLDTVLSIINTAMISHIGTLSSQTITTTTNNVTNKKGTKLTTKMKQQILKSLETNNDKELLEFLCDLRILVVFRKLLQDYEMDELCTCIGKCLRRSGVSTSGSGKNGTIKLSTNLKLVLQSVLST